MGSANVKKKLTFQCIILNLLFLVDKKDSENISENFNEKEQSFSNVK